MTFDESKHVRGKPANAGQFREKTTSAPSASLTRSLSSWTPSDVDGQLAALYEQRAAVMMQLHPLEKFHQRQVAGGGLDRSVRKYEEQIEGLKEQLADVEAKAAPFEDEYRRRPWPRAFFVSTTNGHVHSSMSCSTCRPSTQFNWLTEYSGSTEPEIVEAAGEMACTVCYPEAPVDVLSRPRSFRTVDDEARDERERVKREKAAAKAAKAITMPDGEPIRLGKYERVETISAAKRELARALETLHEDTKHEIPNRSYVAEKHEHAGVLVTAIAHKEGRDESEVRDEAEAKAAKKVDKWFR